MNTPSSGLGNSQELYDLLEYLADCLNHTRECYLHDDEGRLIVPRVTPAQCKEHGWGRRNFGQSETGMYRLYRNIEWNLRRFGFVIVRCT